MSNAKLVRLGWKPRISLHEGLAGAYRAFLDELPG